MAGAAQERADLLEEHRAGRPSRATRSWEEREPPLRGLPDDVLRARLVTEATRFARAVASLAPGETIAYTGWGMSADRLRTHSHSEAALHRWDLVGDDDTGRGLLAAEALTSHALAVFAAIPALAEAQRWVHPSFTARPVRLRSPDRPDVLVAPGSPLSLVARGDGDPVVELDASDRLLVLWGRCPAALRPCSGGAITVDDILGRRLRPR